MASVQLLLLVLALTAWQLNSVDAECCQSHPERGKNKCDDCTGAWLCCGHRKCDLFCCKCDGGCRTGICGWPTKRKRSLDAMLYGVDHHDDAHSAHRIVRLADQDKDGRMSMEEAHAYLGDSPDRQKRDVELQMMDANNDGFITAEEIDPSSLENK